MGQIGSGPKEGRVRHDSRRYDSEGASSRFPKPDGCKGVSMPTLLRQNTDVFFPISLTNGASVSLKGALTQSPGPGQNKELVAETVEVLGACDPEVHRSLT